MNRIVQSFFVIVAVSLIFSCNRNSIMSQRQFQDYVYNLAQKKNPYAKIKKDIEPEIIWNDSSKFSLQNLYKVYVNNSADSVFVRREIEKYLRNTISNTDWISDNFSEMKLKILPQFMPEKFLDVTKDVINREFNCSLKIAYVVDFAEKYQYITKKELEKWKITQPELDSIAFNNLQNNSVGIKLTVLGKSVLMLDSVDAFNAVRIMLPKFQNKVHEILGSKIFFGIPFRDFLVCWDASSADSLNKKLQGMIEDDYQKQDHPLSNCIFTLEKHKIKIRE